MSVDRLPSGRFRGRLMIDGVKYAATFPTQQEANDWVLITKARAITGGLPGRISVCEYAARMATYDTAPSSTRKWHQGNLDRYILPVIGRRPLAQVTPTEISRMLNGVRASVSAAAADPTRPTGPAPRCSMPRLPTTSLCAARSGRRSTVLAASRTAGGARARASPKAAATAGWLAARHGAAAAVFVSSHRRDRWPDPPRRRR